MADLYQNRAPGLTSPAGQAFAVTPSDAADLSLVTRGIYVGTTGNLRALLVGDSVPVTFVNLAGGVTHPMRLRRVYATGTTATGLIGVL